LSVFIDHFLSHKQFVLAYFVDLHPHMAIRESVLKPLLVYFLVFIEEPVCWRLPNVMMMSVLLRFDLKVQDVLVSYPQMEMGHTLEH